MGLTSAINRHVTKAEAVLDANWTGQYTKPATALYPHQWNWDAGFIAIGYSRYDTDRAVAELTHLFKAQWANGMVPQIVFDAANLGRYFPEPDFWQAERSPNAPAGALTSGITMPPIHAVSVLAVYENARDPGATLPFLKWIYPRLLAQHRYLYTERDPDSTGLVYIRHPWESGMDNSPMWDEVLPRIDLSRTKLPDYERRDLKSGVKAEYRPKDSDYDRFVYLVDLFRRLDYDEGAIRAECPFLVRGPLFNSVLSASNEALVKLSAIVGEPAGEAEEWYERSCRAISEGLYHAERGMFDFYDVVEERLLDVDSAAGFMPLFSGAATPEQAARLYDYLNSVGFCALHQGNCFSVPNYDTTKEGFQRENYWRGPIWININWMLMKGLRRYGFTQKADSVAKDILELPIRFGFHEYYDSFDGRGYGSPDFSWTAALFIDAAHETFGSIGEVSLAAKLRKKLWGDMLLNVTDEGAEGEAGGPEGAGGEAPVEEVPRVMLSTIKDLKGKFYTPEGTVDYDALGRSDEYARYRRVAARLAGFDPGLLTGDAVRLAFWINLYNTIVVDGIVALGIKSSVKEVLGFFSRVKYVIGGHRFSPDDIEHGVLRANARPYMHAFRQFGPFDARRRYSLSKVDPRVHFALVCGSRSCAPIKFYDAAMIDDQLTTAAVNFVNSSEVIVMPEENRLVISMLFKWYEADFGGRRGVVDFIAEHLVDEGKKAFLLEARDGVRIEYLYYDWNINK